MTGGTFWEVRNLPRRSTSINERTMEEQGGLGRVKAKCTRPGVPRRPDLVTYPSPTE
jgi:hypothetical protein